MSRTLIVRSTRVVLPDGVRPATIHIEDGSIASVSTGAEETGVPFDFGDLVISPGLVDTHVHVNEPGRTEWEGFDTASRAAAAGGVTTIVDMPLNSVPATTTVAALEAKRTCAQRGAHVDIAFWGGVVPGNAGDVEPLIDAGVRGFKCFLVPSGVDEFRAVEESALRQVLPILARRRVPLLVHAEDPAAIAAAGGLFSTGAWSGATRPPSARYSTYLSSRPPEAEVRAIALMIRLAREFDVHVHIVHVASAEAVEVVARAKHDGVPITAETCPHYLTFAAVDVPDGATEFKCAPPIRDASHRAALWNGLFDRALDLIATDHSPSPPFLKCRGDFARAWGGIASLELSLPATWTAAHEFGCASPKPDTAILELLARWTSETSARLAGLSAKGQIAAGSDADLTIWDPEAETTVDPMRLQQRHKVTPYAQRRLRGVVKATFVRGVCVWDGYRLVHSGGGRLL